MKYYLIAGEASGDLHAANLMKAIARLDSQAEFRFWGGDKMKQAGGSMVHHYRELSYMGFWEVAKNLRKLHRYLDECKQDILKYRPDVFIPVDYSGFNLRIAPVAKKAGIPVHFYIAPKLWAWNEKRAKKLDRYVDALYVIFPFEEEFFRQRISIPVYYVGNPSMDAICDHPPPDAVHFRDTYGLDERPVIALLPGSRVQEIAKILPATLPLAERFPDYQFVIAGAPGYPENFYRRFTGNAGIPVIPNRTYDLLSLAHAAIVASGTATLETALFKVPQVVVYKTSQLTYSIARHFVGKRLKYISLVNIVADSPVVEELIQHQCRPGRIAVALEKILQPDHRTKIFESYHHLETKLGEKGTAGRVAQKILYGN